MKETINGKQGEFCHFAQTYKCFTDGKSCDDVSIKDSYQDLSKEYITHHIAYCTDLALAESQTFNGTVKSVVKGALVDPDFDCSINSTVNLLRENCKYNMTSFDYCEQGFAKATLFNRR